MNKHIKLLLVATVSVLALTGCNKANGPQFTKFDIPQKGKSLLYVYRDDSFIANAVYPDIHQTEFANKQDKVIGEVKRAGYIKSELGSGKKYEIWAKTEVKNEVYIDAKDQGVYCVKHYITPGFFVGHPQFKKVTMDQCTVEISKTKLSKKEK